MTIDGDSFSFKFKTGSNLKGAGINGFDDDKLYTAGKQIKADKDDKYKVYKVTTKADNYCKVEDMTVSGFLKKVQDGIDKVENSVYKGKPLGKITLYRLYYRCHRVVKVLFA